MATIRKSIGVGADPDAAWDALRDFGAVHERVVPGFVTETQLHGDERIVTFFNGSRARERLVTVDDEWRRHVYTVLDGSLHLSHHQASVQVLPQDGPGGGSCVVWLTDVLPHDRAPVIEAMMDQGAEAIARTLAR
jgi:Polyketide cyclase / dehydrase and lipid transport